MASMDLLLGGDYAEQIFQALDLESQDSLGLFHPGRLFSNAFGGRWEVQ